MSAPKYPNVTVHLTGDAEIAFIIVGRVLEALCRAEVPEHEREEFRDEAMSGGYSHLLQTITAWVRTT